MESFGDELDASNRQALARKLVGHPVPQHRRGRRTRKGVFITTSTYTQEAREFADDVGDSIVLVDGQHLAQLMIEHRVGVQVERAFVIPKIQYDCCEDA